MRLPTIGVVVTAASAAARRFPFVLAAAFVATYAGLGMVENRGEDVTGYVRLIAAAALGLPLLFALTLLAERWARTAAQRLGLLAGGAAILVLFWTAWPRWSEPIEVLRFAQLAVGFHLLVAFLPYARVSEPNGFWQYNRALFLRFLTAGLYSSVLFAGLAVALLATDKLLGVHVPGEGYGRLWVVIAFVFNTWFFVGGVPRDLAALDSYDDYPTGLRLFTQYVLVPIVAIYLLILTIYLGKVLITRQWPSGWIGYLVSSVATVGILSWLLVHPLERQPEYAWVKTFTRGFYLVLMPAIVMLWLAIWKRVEQYGITERRYFLIVLSIWLAGIAIYYTLARSRSIKVIPATLCAVALITFAGPWGAYGVSRASQTRRLRGMLERNGLLATGRLQPAAGEVSFADRREISSGFRYLLATHGDASIVPWLTDAQRRALPPGVPLSRRGDGEAGARAILTSLHLEYVTPWQSGQGGDSFYYYATATPEPVPIAGYTHAVRISFAPLKESIKVGEGAIVRLGQDSLSLRVERSGGLLLELPLAMLVDSAMAYRRRTSTQALPPALLRVEAASSGVGALAVFTQLSGTLRQGAARLTALEGELFLRLP